METTGSPARPALIALLLLLVSLALTFLVGPGRTLSTFSQGQPQPALLFLSTPTAIDIYLSTLGEQGLLALAQVVRLDFANALLIIVAGVLVIRWLASHLPTDVRWPGTLVLLPVLTGVTDIIENGLTLRAIAAFPALSPSSLPWVTSTKLLLLLFTLLAIAALAAIALRLRRLAPITL